MVPVIKVEAQKEIRHTGPIKATIPQKLFTATAVKKKDQGKYMSNMRKDKTMPGGKMNSSSSSNSSSSMPANPFKKGNSGSDIMTSDSSRKNPATPDDPDLEDLYDDYLISELVLKNAREMRRSICEKNNMEVVEMGTAVQILRREVQSMKLENAKKEKMLEFLESAATQSGFVANGTVTECLSKTEENLTSLAGALEQSRHHLKVLGVEVNPGDEKKLLQVLKDNAGLLEDREKKHDRAELESLEKGAQSMSNLDEYLGDSIRSSDRCNDLLKSLKNESIHAASLMVTKQRMQRATNAANDSSTGHVTESRRLLNKYGGLKCSMDDPDDA